MKILVSEFITGGGLAGQALPESLFREGEMMLAALLSDLQEITHVDLYITRDARLSLKDFPGRINCYPVEGDYIGRFREYCLGVDAVFPIAPETDNVLEKVSAVVLEEGKRLLGSSPAAIQLTASKMATAKLLAERQIRVVETRLFSELVEPWYSDTGWIVKPDQGVGCDHVFYCESEDEIRCVAAKCKNPVVQPKLNGIHGSLSMLCHMGQGVVIGYNEQIIEMQNHCLHYAGTKVNALTEFRDQLDELAASICAVLPGLEGYVGVDVLIRDNEAIVMEINPRMTTSYAALGKSMGQNPVQLLFDLFFERKLPEIDPSRFKPVEVRI